MRKVSHAVDDPREALRFGRGVRFPLPVDCYVQLVDELPRVVDLISHDDSLRKTDPEPRADRPRGAFLSEKASSLLPTTVERPSMMTERRKDGKTEMEYRDPPSVMDRYRRRSADFAR
jgi:hypothetical protein